MKRFAARCFLLIFPWLFATGAMAQAPSSHVAEAANRAARNTPHVAPVVQHLFGAIPLSTQSIEARKFIELAWDKYENSMYDDAIVNARHATEKDPQSALSYALLSFVGRRGIPNSAALAKAKSLLPRTTSDEQLLVRWMTSIQDRDLLPAIMNMNDLLEHYPKDKHVLYLTAEWLYLQQDYDRARTMMETALQIDPNFPAALNRLGHVYAEAGELANAVASLKRYAEVEPGSPIPEDSLGEVLRASGDDRGSLEHYSAALQIDPTYFASQVGLGDTLTLMGDFSSARKEYDRAFQIAENPRDGLNAKYQKALVYFWEGNAAEGRKVLAALSEQAADKKEPNMQFAIALGRAMLAANSQDELEQLGTVAAFLEQPLAGMSESNRGIARATVLRERVRVAALNGLSDLAAGTISKLEGLATSSRDFVIENAYESARGFALFQERDFQNAADELAADSRSPLALQQLAITQERLGKPDAARSTRALLKSQRGPTVEWFLVTHPDAGKSH
jgi:tetratricopeptide (TPR) repeat protein